MSAKRQETRHCRYGGLATRAARLPALYRMRTTLPACFKATNGHAGLHGAERHAQWGYQPSAQGSGAAWLDEPRKYRSRRIRASGGWLDLADQAGRQEGLQPVGGHAVPAGLRPEKDRPRIAHLHGPRLDAGQSNGGEDTHRGSASHLETRPQKQFGMTRHGTKSESSFRHGTKSIAGTVRIGDFVPPRNETPRFSGLGCPAMGHLSRYAICTEYEEGEVH